MDQQSAAVRAGHWPLLRFDPRLLAAGRNPLQLDSAPPSLPLESYMYNEGRYAMLSHSDPATAAHLLEAARADVRARRSLYAYLAAKPVEGGEP